MGMWGVGEDDTKGRGDLTTTIIYIVFLGWNQHSIATNAKTKAVEKDMTANQEDQT